VGRAVGLGVGAGVGGAVGAGVGGVVAADVTVTVPFICVSAWMMQK
jgi:hypothetical protein